ncbi:hypothetical protein QBC37DRAFT_419013 [Rhypophila decipiens]|uniref:Uncharacterized protein n=1 Tax=Rhypophila decipiens TaxID=261697 RepID=A0AAN6YCG2_9PEZI|nr:hypothetical protein QBC37DRAFT_419013 [Rhypophila decipiens]
MICINVGIQAVKSHVYYLSHMRPHSQECKEFSKLCIKKVHALDPWRRDTWELIYAPNQCISAFMFFRNASISIVDTLSSLVSHIMRSLLSLSLSLQIQEFFSHSSHIQIPKKRGSGASPTTFLVAIQPLTLRERDHLSSWILKRYGPITGPHPRNCKKCRPHTPAIVGFRTLRRLIVPTGVSEAGTRITPRLPLQRRLGSSQNWLTRPVACVLAMKLFRKKGGGSNSAASGTSLTLTSSSRGRDETAEVLRVACLYKAAYF